MTITKQEYARFHMNEVVRPLQVHRAEEALAAARSNMEAMDHGHDLTIRKLQKIVRQLKQKVCAHAGMHFHSIDS